MDLKTSTTKGQIIDHILPHQSLGSTFQFCSIHLRAKKNRRHSWALSCLYLIKSDDETKGPHQTNRKGAHIQVFHCSLISHRGKYISTMP